MSLKMPGLRLKVLSKPLELQRHYLVGAPGMSGQKAHWGLKCLTSHVSVICFISESFPDSDRRNFICFGVVRGASQFVPSICKNILTIARSLVLHSNDKGSIAEGYCFVWQRREGCTRLAPKCRPRFQLLNFSYVRRAAKTRNNWCIFRQHRGAYSRIRAIVLLKPPIIMAISLFVE